jgi:hypothetical protein
MCIYWLHVWAATTTKICMWLHHNADATTVAACTNCTIQLTSLPVVRIIVTQYDKPCLVGPLDVRRSADITRHDACNRGTRLQWWPQPTNKRHDLATDSVELKSGSSCGICTTCVPASCTILWWRLQLLTGGDCLSYATAVAQETQTSNMADGLLGSQEMYMPWDAHRCLPLTTPSTLLSCDSWLSSSRGC